MIGDGFVVVSYPANLPTTDVTALREYIVGPEGNKVVGGAAPAQAEKLKATNAYDTLKCTEFDMAALKQFSKGWFADPRSRTPE